MEYNKKVVLELFHNILVSILPPSSETSTFNLHANDTVRASYTHSRIYATLGNMFLTSKAFR